ncbi:MAG TPA: nucleotidyl transferase AbiEii/AbiGii toxin family protein [Verrucomicrobiota bacterium]|nr:nucleotidyl transferase AbiEii/AbiGii toxin family protein [Verrucomicrobiota bacterium]
MPEADLLSLFAAPLNRLGAPYFVGGSVASMLYGEPRVTHDIDLVVELRSADLPGLAAAFPAPEFYLPPVAVIALELTREQRGHFNAIHVPTGLKADFYPAGRDPLHAWAFPRRRQFDCEGIRLPVAPPEYVILRKLEYLREGGSEKHVRDIRGMLAVAAAEIDRIALEEWILRRGVMDLWQTVNRT